jgi:hypothetical protein
VPAHAELTRLFPVITVTGTEAGVGPHGPVGMAAVLATAAHLTAGPHRFTVRWAVPRDAASDPGYQVAAAAYWPRGRRASRMRRRDPWRWLRPSRRPPRARRRAGNGGSHVRVAAVGFT